MKSPCPVEYLASKRYSINTLKWLNIEDIDSHLLITVKPQKIICKGEVNLQMPLHNVSGTNEQVGREGGRQSKGTTKVKQACSHTSFHLD